MSHEFFQNNGEIEKFVSGHERRMSSPDYYLEHPVKKPKKEIAEYVESKGILVPRRFATLEDALDSGKPFIARSEHPQDYAGASDLVDSVVITPQIISDAYEKYDPQAEIEWNKVILGYYPLAHAIAQLRHVSQEVFEANITKKKEDYIMRYCKILGIPFEEFNSQFSYSYWELLEGFNRAVIADNAISGRYHIFTHSGLPHEYSSRKSGYMIIENGKKIAGMSDLPQEIDEDYEKVIETYETIRNLDRFDAKHCPIIELQTVDKEHYFLQYHRGRNEALSSYTLDRDRKQGEYEAAFVRGATPPEGIEVNLGVNWDEELPVEPEAGIDHTWGPLTESQVRTRRLQIKTVSNDPRLIYKSDEKHLTRSELFKPEVSMILYRTEHDNLLQDIDYNRENPNQTVRVKVTSDGRRALIQRT